jgi:hypothetical protein
MAITVKTTEAQVAQDSFATVLFGADVVGFMWFPRAAFVKETVFTAPLR